MAKSNKASLGFVFITILIDMIGIGMIIPIAPKLVEELTGKPVEDVSLYYMVVLLSYAVTQFIFSPILGALSDKYGRRPILLISIAGLSLDYIFQAFAPTFIWLVVGRIIGGACGASHTVASAYVSDISTHENKAKNFGIIGAAFGMGFIIGPALGGLVSNEFGIRAPFILAAILGGINFLYGLLLIPESLPKEKRRELNWNQANPLTSILKLRRYKLLFGLLFAFFLMQVAGQSLPATWAIFSEYQFGWDEFEIGLSLSFVGLMVAIVQGGLTGVFVKKFGSVKTIIIGFSLWTFGMAMFAFSVEAWMLYAFTVPYCLGGIAGPTLQGIISNQVPDNEQGELQGALTSLVSLSGIFGYAIANPSFDFFTGDSAPIEFPGAPYFIAAIFLIVASILTIRALKKNKSKFLNPDEKILDDSVIIDGLTPDSND